MLVMHTTIGIQAGITQEMALSGNGAYTLILSIPSLQMGVFGGLIAGILAAVMYNRFHDIQLPAFLGFFSGKRFVPIATALSAFLLGLILPSIWVHVQGAGKFMQGEFPLMLFALPAACLAMYHEAKTKNKKFAAGILFSAALTCFLTGITEPVEFTFIFVSPLLYIFNAISTGFAYMFMYLLDAHLAKSFSAGFIDYFTLGILPSMNGFETNYFAAVIVGVPMAIMYYFVFRFVIRKFNVQTPGRTDEVKETIVLSDEQLTKLTLDFLGGKDNLTSVTSCITRLRLEVKDTSLVNAKGLEDIGAMGVINVGSSGVQVIFGAKAQFIADRINNT